MLWECKSANEKKFRDFRFKGIKANPTYEVQVALYQAYMELTDNPCLFTVINKNTSEIFYQLVPFNQDLAQYASDRAVDILRASKQNEMLPRIAQNKDVFDCRFCQFQILVGVRGDGDTEGSKAPPSPMEMVMNIIKFGNSKRSMDSKELVEMISQKVPASVQIDMLKKPIHKA